MTSLSIKLEKNEELTPQFLDLFSKLIISNTDFFLGQHIQGQTQIKYRQFQQYLCNSSQLKHNGLKSPISKSNKAFTFNFQSMSNNLVFLLDLSPYMLIYDYGTKSFPLKNLQEIVIYLLKKLSERQKQNKDYQFKITIYLFSIYKKQLQLIILNDFINENSCELLCSFINKTIQKSTLPYEKSSRKQNLRDIFQRMFNTEQTNLGIKTIVIISSFHQEESAPFLLFTPNWYTYGFISTGGHFGSYVVDNQQIHNKIMMGNYFKTKYIFKANFLQNWEMTERIRKYQPPENARTINSMFRSILFEYEGKMHEDIFQFLLRFQVTFKEMKKNKMVSGAESVISTMKDNTNKIVYKTYKIAGDSFIYILRTRYVQGWQPVLLNFTSMVQNSKFKLRLHLNNNSYLYYQAVRNQNNFIITIYQNNSGNIGKDLSNSDKVELANTIQKMDKINSYNFINLVNQNERLKELKSNTKSSILLFHNNQYEIINDLCNNIGQWGKYFKIKRICFKLTPQLTSLSLEEFINEISFILGKKISKFIFVKQSESQKKSERIDEIENCNRRVMFSKIDIFGNIIELELAFLRFIYKDILATLEQLTNKLHNRKFKWGVIQKVPNRLVSFFKDNNIINHSLFNRKWVLKTKSKYYKKLFNIYWQEILKKTCYQKFHIKNNQNLEKNYYKIIQIKTDHCNITEKVAFLKVKQSHEKDAQIMFQIAMPPCLINIYPYFKEQQGRNKPINLSQLVNILGGQLKKTQEEIIKLIDSYQIIHLKLLKNAINSHPKLLNHYLEKENSELYDIKINHFRSILSIQCKEIITKYYRQNCKQVIKTLPIPNKLLMNTELDHIQGDINLKFEQKQYSFFLCTPYKFIYLYRKQNSIFYKVVNLYYEEYNVRQSQNSFLQKIINQIINNINEQIYCKDFRVFLQGNFKGGIAKIINNQEYTRTQQNKIQLQSLFQSSEKHHHYFTMQPHTIEHKRLRKIIQIFKDKLFLLIHQFFPLLRINYYFQIRKNKHSSPPFAIDTQKSRQNTEVFMRVTFNSDQGEGIDISPSNLTDFIMKHYFDILKNKSFLFFRFYLQIKNNSQSENTFIFIDYFTNLIECLIKDISFQIERVLIIKKDIQFSSLGFLHCQPKVESVKLQNIINQQSQNPQSLSRYIESSSMQHEMHLKRIQENPPEFILVGEDQSMFFIERLMIMKIVSNVELLFIYRPSIFFEEEQKVRRNQINEYLKKLINYINASKLVEQLKNTLELPFQPYELYLNQSANHPNNRIVAIKKKKVTKNPVTKYLKKNITNQQATPTAHNVNHRIQSNNQIRLNLIYRNIVPLNKRISNNQGLQALKQDQIFTLNAIQNLKNTYLFYCQKNYIILHFEETQDEKVINKIRQENNLSFYNCKKYLLYYVFCLDPLIKKESIQNFIYQILKEAVNRKLFDEVSEYLLTYSDIMEEDEEYFIKGSGRLKKQLKQFKFDLPNQFYKDQLLSYLTQHIQTYHFKVQFKSQLQRASQSKNQLGTIEQQKSIRYFQERKSENTQFHLLENFNMKLSFNKRSLSMNQTNEYFSSSTNFDRPKYGNMSFTKQGDISSSFQQDMSMVGLTNMSMSGLNLLRHGDNFFSDSQSQSLYKAEYIDGNWLFNCASPKFNFTQTYGKCIYLLKIKIRQEVNNSGEHQIVTFGKDKFSFNLWHQQSKLSQFKQTLLKKNTNKSIKRDSAFKSTLSYEIADYVGIGIIKFTEIQDSFSFIIKSALAEYYIQNYLHVQFKNIINWIQKQRGVRQTASKQAQSLKNVSQQNNKVVQDASQKQMLTIKDIYDKFIEWRQQLYCIMQNINSLLFYKYRSTNSLIKDISFYFIHFLEEFTAILHHLYEAESLNQIYFLIYVQISNQKDIYCKIHCNDIATIKSKLNAFTHDQIQKIGFILCDYFDQINDFIDNKKIVNDKNGKFNNLKYFKNIQKQQQNDKIQFRRSLLVNYEINYEYFIYQSYNLNPEIDKQLKDYLSPIDCWMNQKNKLYKFIKNIKENNVYEVSYKNTQDKKINPFYQIRYSQRGKHQFENYKLPVKMERLLINLVFDDLPMAIPKASLQNQQQKGNKFAKQSAKQPPKQLKIRYKFAHHCTQIRQLFETLKKTPVNYSLYNPYKGSEKFLLQRLGREYISILRNQHSINK